MYVRVCKHTVHLFCYFIVLGVYEFRKRQLALILRVTSLTPHLLSLISAPPSLSCMEPLSFRSSSFLMIGSKASNSSGWSLKNCSIAPSIQLFTQAYNKGEAKLAFLFYTWQALKSMRFQNQKQI